MSNENEITLWYEKQIPVFNSLAEIVATTLSAVLRANKVDFLAVSHRTKTLTSVIEKSVRKEYTELSEMTDIAGIRVITYIEHDVERAAKFIEEVFLVHLDKSIDKSQELSDDKFGYRSVHFVCELGDARVALPELAQFKGMVFEVQIRTVLQHAWAEIEHDRSYKFTGELPSPIRRRLNLLAGVLELADREFGLLAQEVDDYANQVKESAKSGSLEKEELTSLSVSEYLKSSDKWPFANIDSRTDNTDLGGVIGELKRFGINTIDELDNLLSPSFLDCMKKYAPKTTLLGTFRRAMLFSDMERYFSKAWNKRWQGISQATVSMLLSRYGENSVNTTLERFKVRRKENFVE